MPKGRVGLPPLWCGIRGRYVSSVGCLSSQLHRLCHSDINPWTARCKASLGNQPRPLVIELPIKTIANTVVLLLERKIYRRPN